jgi:hypothetical protein
MKRNALKKIVIWILVLTACAVLGSTAYGQTAGKGEDKAASTKKGINNEC